MDRFVFSSVNAARNTGFYASDGTASDTTQILGAGATGSITGLRNWGDKPIIAALYGVLLSDGTASGTVALPPGDQPGTHRSIGVAGDMLFVAASGSNGASGTLTVRDGTAAGPVRVPGLASIGGALTVVANGVVFDGTDTSGRQALFTSDGTGSGSMELALPSGVAASDASVISALRAPDAVAPVDAGIVTLPGGAQYYAAMPGTTVLAGSGADTISASLGQVTVVGGSGSLLFVGGAHQSSVTGGAGSTTLFGGTGGGTYTGGAGGNNILVSENAIDANTTLTGAAAGDRIFGSGYGSDLLVAGAGRESVVASSSYTTVDGGTAPDVIFGGGATVNGGAGGGDTIVGGSVVNARDGDAIFGAVNVIGSASGADTIIGAHAVTGQGGNMLVTGDPEDSTSILTGNGASLIFMEGGNNNPLYVTGGNGSLQVVLSSGDATINEGNGPATFDVLNDIVSNTTAISGFKPNVDRIDVFGLTPTDLTVKVVGGNSLINLPAGTPAGIEITLLGVTDVGHSIVFA